jgi:AraC family transcriptional activator of tynA and feaB
MESPRRIGERYLGPIVTNGERGRLPVYGCMGVMKLGLPSKSMVILGILAAVRARLVDPDLNVQTIADAVGLSARYANSILASQDTSIGRLILTERLERCRRSFEDQAQSHRTVSEVAFGWGFSDLTHFGRSFKKTYGMSPSEYQASHRKP